LSYERVVENIHQLNLSLRSSLYTLKRIAFTTSRASEMKTRAKEPLSINLHSEKYKYIRILQMLETQLKEIEKETLYSTTLPHVSPL